MAMYKKIVLAPVVAFAVVCLLTVGVRTEPDITPVGYSCYGELDPLSPNQAAVQEVRDDLIDETANRAFNYYTSAQFAGGARCYGHALCNLRKPAEDCITCLIVAETVILHTCGFPGTAWLVLKDCGLRWQFNAFVD